VRFPDRCCLDLDPVFDGTNDIVVGCVRLQQLITPPRKLGVQLHPMRHVRLDPQSQFTSRDGAITGPSNSFAGGVVAWLLASVRLAFHGNKKGVAATALQS